MDRSNTSSRGSGRLALMVVHQHKAAQFGDEMPGDPGRQRRQDRAALRRDPALALIAGRAHRDHQILHQEPLVPRAWWNRHGYHLLLDNLPRGDLAAAPPIRRMIALRRLGAFVHAAWPDPRSLRQVLHPRVSERARARQMSGTDDEFPLDPVDPRLRPVGIGDQPILRRAMPSLVPGFTSGRG